MNLNDKKPEWGFYTGDGKLVPVSQLTVPSLKYVAYSITQLKELLTEYLSDERYEQCADIRDELLRRGKHSAQA